jgi:SlyX protein
MESRLEKIETKLSFSEDLLEELNRTVVRQQQEIERLQKQVRALREQFATLLPGPTDAPHDEPPPHY